MYQAIIQPITAPASAPNALRKRKAAEVEVSLHSQTRLRNSLAANMDPCCPDDNGKSKFNTAIDAQSPGNSKRRRSSGAGGSSAGHENNAPDVDASLQGSVGYVPLLTSIFSNIVNFTTSFFSSSADGAAAAPVSAPAAVAAAAPAAKPTRTVVQTKSFAFTPENLMNETPAR
jgi:hypothetical protein